MSIPKEPKTMTEALVSLYWFHTMSNEYSALLNNQTWELVPNTSEMHVVVTNGSIRPN